MVVAATILGAVLLSCLASTASAGGFCGGFDLADRGQARQCMTNSGSRNGCYNRYGVRNSCWRQTSQSSCCNHGQCSGRYDRYNQHCRCNSGWSGARCDKSTRKPPPPPPPPSRSAPSPPPYSGSYKLLTKHYCQHTLSNTKSSLATAKRKCAANSRCHSLYDNSCDGNGWVLCADTASQASRSSSGSCLYLKGSSTELSSNGGCKDQSKTGFNIRGKAATCHDLREYCTSSTHGTAIKKVCCNTCNGHGQSSPPPPPPPRNACTGQLFLECLSTYGCGWCMTGARKAKCIASSSGHSQCSKGWETGNH